MNITKFSLPEGCDLKLKLNGIAARIVVMYKGEEISVVSRTMIGLRLSVRRAILGVNYVVEHFDDSTSGSALYSLDLRQRIRDSVNNFRSSIDILNDNMRHFGSLDMSQSSIAQMREIAEQSYRTTRARIDGDTSVSFRITPQGDTFTLQDLRGEYLRGAQLDPIRPHAVQSVPTYVGPTDLTEE